MSGPQEPVAQPVEHLTFNQGVAGSNPAGLTRERSVQEAAAPIIGTNDVTADRAKTRGGSALIAPAQIGLIGAGDLVSESSLRHALAHGVSLLR